MRVLCLAPERSSASRLTATTVIDEEIEALARAGVEMYVLSPEIGAPENRGAVKLRSTRRGGPLKHVAFPFLLRHAGHIPWRHCLRHAGFCNYVGGIEEAAARLVRDEHIDVIHSHFAFPGGLGGLLASRATGCPLVASFRGMDLARQPELSYGLRLNPFFDAAVRGLLRGAARTIYVSDFMKEEGIALGAVPERAITIRKGVDLEKFRPRDASTLRTALSPDAPIVLVVSNLLPVKGVGDAVAALGLLRDTCDFTLVVCGDGPQRAALESLAADLGIGGRTRFVGKVDRNIIGEYFAAADVFLLPSVREASGNVLLEAAAAGKPAICTASGGPPEYVVHGTTGLVARPQDPHSLAEQLRILLTNEELRIRMGSAARSHAEAVFGYDRMIREIKNVYESVV